MSGPAVVELVDTAAPAAGRPGRAPAGRRPPRRGPAAPPAADYGWSVAGAVLVGLALRAAIGLTDDAPTTDEVAYIASGTSLADGGGFARGGHPELHFPPLVPWLLGTAAACSATRTPWRWCPRCLAARPRGARGRAGPPAGRRRRWRRRRLDRRGGARPRDPARHPGRGPRPSTRLWPCRPWRGGGRGAGPPGACWPAWRRRPLVGLAGPDPTEALRGGPPARCGGGSCRLGGAARRAVGRRGPWLRSPCSPPAVARGALRGHLDAHTGRVELDGEVPARVDRG